MTATNAFSDRPWLAAYADGVPQDLAPSGETLSDMLESSAARFGRNTALVYFGATTRYEQLLRRVDRVAEGLRRRGVGVGDRVALVLPNCPEQVIAFYAVLRLGAIVVEHNPTYTTPEFERLFADHGARVAIVWDNAVDAIVDLSARVRPEHIIRVDITESMPWVQRTALRLPISRIREQRAKLSNRSRRRGTVPWRRLLADGALASEHARPRAEDTALIQYTSGTTGEPKGAVLSHRNLRANAAQGHAWVPQLRNGEETFYAVLPLFHVYGLTLCLTFAVSIGARVVLFPAFDVSLVTRAARRTPATFLPAVPPIYDQLVRAAQRGNIDLSTIRYSISGAMSLPAGTAERWESAGGGLLVEGYGMTETSPVSLGNPMGPTRRIGTVGVPFPGTDIRIVDPEDPSVVVPSGAPGELLIRGPQVFGGYWNRPEDTAAVLLPGGWIRTGDIVTATADGFVTVVDRIKEIIITGGFNVSPSEVEAVLKSHPDVVDAAVVSLPRGNGGEIVAAAIVPRDGMGQGLEALRGFCRARLAAYKVPTRIDIVDDLPRSLVGKTLRRHVRDRMLAGVPSPVR